MVVALFVLAVATLTTNMAANVVAPANGFSTSRRGGSPSRWAATSRPASASPCSLGSSSQSTGGYIFTWLIGYSALLGPIAGILIADYFLIRRTELVVPDLFRSNGRYRFQNGWNPVALVALALGVLPNLPGFLAAAGALDKVPTFWTDIYTYAWFVGFFVSGGVYFLLTRLSPSSQSSSPPATA